MAVEDALDIFGSDPFGRDYLYGLSTGRDGQGLAPYGTRYAESLNQPITAKGRGYLGNVGTMQDPMTELSASSEIGGRTVQYPLIVPTLTAQELNLLRSGGEPTQEIYGKAQQYALGRLSRGLDPFATTQELRYPQPEGFNPAPRAADRVQESPRGFTSGLFSDVFGRTLNMPSIPRTGIPALDLLSPNMNLLNRLSFGDLQKTAERISYGQPLTTGSGMTLRPREETIFAGMAVAPFVGEAAVLGARGARTGARMVGQEIADRVATGQSMLPSGFAEPRPSLFAVEPSPMMPKPQAPVSPLGFYSAAEQAALNLQRTKGTGQSFLNDLMKAPDVKKDELQYTGLDEFLKDKPNVTKQEVTDYLANNKVDVKEVILGGNTAPSQDLLSWMSSRSIMTPRNPEGWQELSQKLERYAQQHQKAQGAPETSQRYFRLSEEAGRISEGLDAGGSAAGATKYNKYQLAGGDNYREILLTLPNQWEKPRAAQIANEARIKELRQEMYGTSGTDEIRQEISRLHNENTVLQKQISDAPIYKSSHFDQPNILAHIRANDRVDADGKKMLLVEEIQSDWHQAGREKGYKGQFKDLPNDYKIESKIDKDGYSYYVVLDPQGNVFAKDYNKGSVTNQAINRLNETIGGVPDAPFKDTWYQLSLKRLLKYAADNGYERVGLTTGTQQAKRYDLGNEVDSINVESVAEVPNLQFVDIDVIGGQKIALEVENGVVREGEFAGKRLSDVVGKEMADKITNVAKGETKSLAGEDLRIGGEGMKRYYDEIYPKYLEKYGKKFDASVGETKVNTVMQRADNSMIPQMGQEPVRYIDITPKMKESVGKGQPLFTAIPAGTLGLGGLEYADPFANPLAEDTTR